jgi:hypothetical protein
MLDTSIETYTLRNNPGELALPMRKWDIPPVGDGPAVPARIGTASPGASFPANSYYAAT